MEFPTIDKFAKEVAEKALDEITYEGKTVREWVEIIVKQQPSEIHCEFSDENVAKAFIEDVESVKDKLPKSSEDCRNCKKWNKCPCGKEGHENGTSIGYSIGECKDYEPCDDCISRQAVLDIWHTTYSNVRIENEEIQYKKIAYELPSVYPERPKGKWIEIEDNSGEYHFECSECGRRMNWGDENDNYCRCCGAFMNPDGEG